MSRIMRWIPSSAQSHARGNGVCTDQPSDKAEVLQLHPGRQGRVAGKHMQHLLGNHFLLIHHDYPLPLPTQSAVIHINPRSAIMKLINTALLFAVATRAVVVDQQVFRAYRDPHLVLDPHASTSDSASRPASALNTLDAKIKEMKVQVDAVAAKSADILDKTLAVFDKSTGIFEKTAALWPEFAQVSPFHSHPKPHYRKQDSEWDHVVKGSDIQSVWVENAQGHKQRDLDGKLANYNMRIKSVDPGSLGVDHVKQYSGYLDDEDEDKHLFYWFFESRNDPENDPVVLWLNGGPGCSSLTGLFMELGPSFVNKKIGLDRNPFSWNSNASVIFLDQPVNVGYSYSGSSVSNTIAAGKDVYALMTLFFKQFPQYAKQDFHIAGESYAGHYIPVFASEILSHKKRNINLQSVLIGNGLTDGYTQYAYYRPMACGEGGYPAVLDKNQCQAMDDALPRCQSLIERCYDSDSVWACVPSAIYCNNAMLGPYQQTGRNVYDIRGPCEDSSNLCYKEMGWIQEYLNKPAVMKALGAEVQSYESCNFDINRNFLFQVRSFSVSTRFSRHPPKKLQKWSVADLLYHQGDWMRPFHHLVPELLKQIPVLVYAVSLDLPLLDCVPMCSKCLMLYPRGTPTSSATGSETWPGLRSSIGLAKRLTTKPKWKN